MQRRIVPDIVSDQQRYTLVTEDMTVRATAEIMAEKRIGAVMVAKAGKLIGVFSERDILNRVVAKGLDPQAVKIADVMTRNPQTVSPDVTVGEALDLMQSRGFRHLPILDGERIVAICSIRDLFAAVNEELTEDLKQRDEIMFGAGYGG
ncbi:cyclic nucleotide-binding/CBS domain-containing protein [Lacibacterium aquatile]|uniref:Cyclic nucleotide-binding/CBS domain-containing protein n=1 Tax=Lacibacterium aquatile TaxID=1168082 RepID=A0ABW5DNF4_9PROT